MNADDAGPAEQVVQRDQVDAGGRPSDVGIVGQHAHPEGAGEPGGGRPHVAQAHQPEDLGPQLEADRPRPASGTDLAVAAGEPPRQVERRTDHVLGHRPGVEPAAMEHRHAPPTEGLQVKVVEPGPQAADHPEPRGVGQQLSVHPRLVADHQPGAAADLVEQGSAVGPEPGTQLDGEPAAQRFEAGVNGLGDQDSVGCAPAHPPLKPPAVSPRTRARCTNRNPTASGTVVTTEAAIRPPQSVLNTPLKLSSSPAGSVRRSMAAVKVSGKSRLFQAFMKAKETPR